MFLFEKPPFRPLRGHLALRGSPLCCVSPGVGKGYYDVSDFPALWGKDVAEGHRPERQEGGIRKKVTYKKMSYRLLPVVVEWVQDEYNQAPLFRAECIRNNKRLTVFFTAPS